jgi:hypothetical protein
MNQLTEQSLESEVRKNIRSELSQETDLSMFESSLQNRELNSKLNCAWVSKIIPEDDNTDVTVVFQLPSGFLQEEDMNNSNAHTFEKYFHLPEDRLPEESQFTQFLRSCGCYSMSNIQEDVLGEKVSIEYDSGDSEWKLEAIDTKDETKSTEKIVDPHKRIKQIISSKLRSVNRPITTGIVFLSAGLICVIYPSLLVLFAILLLLFMNLRIFGLV